MEEEKQSFVLRVKEFFKWLIIVLFTLVVLYFVIASNEQLKKEVFSNHLSFLNDIHLPKKFDLNHFSLDFLNKNSKNKKIRNKSKTSSKKQVREVNPEKLVTIHLKNGSSMTGELIARSNGNYTLYWEGAIVTFQAVEIDRVEKSENAQAGIQIKESERKPAGIWPYQNEVVVKLTNGDILDALIVAADKTQITLQHKLEGGGTMEQDLDRSKIESLLFKPVDNSESKRIEETLKKQFPKMKFYPEGNFTIVTDSYETWVKEYKSILRRNYTDLYLEFLKLFKDKKQKVQNFIVIFDNHTDFVEYAVADGVPGWAVLGYFRPDNQILYLFNALGDQFSEMIEEAIVGQTGRAIDRAADNYTQAVGKRYEAFVDGQAQDIKDKFGKAHNLIRDIFRKMTVSTLKHESTHEIFNTWGLQTVIVSKVEKTDDAALMEKKKKFLEAGSIENKRKLLQDLMSMRKKEALPDLNASNSWFVEGLATFAETDTLGEVNEQWLYILQRMMEKNALYPISQLTVYRMGSFPGVAPEAQIQAYAESWAFVTFLMKTYPNQFMDYLKKVSIEIPKDDEDLKWLLEALDKDPATLEAEFLEFLKKFEPVDDPDVKHLKLMQDVFQSF